MNLVLSSIHALTLVGALDANPPPAGTALPPAAGASGIDPLPALEHRIADQTRAFRRWRAAWTATYGTLAVGNLALLPVSSREARIDLYTGAVTSLLAIAPMFILTQPTACPEAASSDPGGGQSECTWTAIAAHQRDSRRWPAHVVNVAYNAAIAAFLGFGYRRWTSASINLVLGIAVGELQIFTHPYRAALDSAASVSRPR
jgi:hypothetical protein